MRLGLVGLPLSGKTTVFNTLTGLSRPLSPGIAGKLDIQIAAVNVPDPRLDALWERYPDKKKVHAQVTYADIGGLAKGISAGGLSGPFRNQLGQTDGFLHVVRAFEDPNIPPPEGNLDPQGDLEILDNEFLLSDLITVENRITRLKEEMERGKDRAANAKELAFFETLYEALEAEKPLRDLDLSEAECHSLRGYGLLTLKPKLVLLNLGDEEAAPDTLVDVRGAHTAVLPIQGMLEMEIAQLEPEEAAIFMGEYGIQEPMRDRIIRQSYRLLGVQTFFTVGDDEVRAWSCPVGATAPEAAGEIHSDMQRGFIRADIIPIETLLELGGMSEARQAGKLRSEGKDYVMQEGDVMMVKFNV